jgi:hypothetical protein
MDHVGCVDPALILPQKGPRLVLKHAVFLAQIPKGPILLGCSKIKGLLFF